MTTYVESGEHLKVCMTLLKDDRKMVQYEGFHVFKVCHTSSHTLSGQALIQQGFCCESEQISRGAAHSGQQPRQATAIPTYILRRPDRG